MGARVTTATVSGNLNGVVAATATPGPVVELTNSIVPGSLSFLFDVTPDTNTITIEGGLEVSDDAATWFSMPVQNNVAQTVFGTGTAGADTAIKRVMPVPLAAWGWRYVRPTVINRVVTGGTIDLFAMTGRYRRKP
jgi:hypothetical protein